LKLRLADEVEAGWRLVLVAAVGTILLSGSWLILDPGGKKSLGFDTFVLTFLACAILSLDSTLALAGGNRSRLATGCSCLVGTGWLARSGWLSSRDRALRARKARGGRLGLSAYLENTLLDCTCRGFEFEVRG
jgi:hypothetical protein